MFNCNLNQFEPYGPSQSSGSQLLCNRPPDGSGTSGNGMTICRRHSVTGSAPFRDLISGLHAFVTQIHMQWPLRLSERLRRLSDSRPSANYHAIQFGHGTSYAGFQCFLSIWMAIGHYSLWGHERSMQTPLDKVAGFVNKWQQPVSLRGFYTSNGSDTRNWSSTV